AGLVGIVGGGGLSTRLSAVRPVLRVSAVLGTVGVGVSVAVVAVAARWLLVPDWTTAVLLGATVSSTDAAAVFSVLRRLRLRSRVSGILEVESGVNDAPAVVLVSLVVAGDWGRDPLWVVVVL